MSAKPDPKSPDLPVLGCAVTLAGLRHNRAWIIEKQRDLEIQDFISAEVLNGDWHPLVAEIRKELDGYQGRLGLHGPFSGFSIAAKDPDIRAIAEKRMHQGLDVCEALGATQMVIHSPYTTWDFNNLDYTRGAREGVVERAQLTLGAVVRRAVDIGCELVIENIEDKDAHARVALAQSFGTEMVKASLDTGHANYAHWSTGGPPVDFYVHAAGAMLHHVHLQDTDGYADRHWKPGDGNIRWVEVFRALSALTSRPRLLLELRRHEDIKAGAEHLVALGLAQ